MSARLKYEMTAYRRQCGVNGVVGAQGVRPTDGPKVRDLDMTSAQDKRWTDRYNTAEVHRGKKNLHQSFQPYCLRT